MIPEERIQEIKILLRKGEPEGEIKEQLKREGYTEEDIMVAFSPHRYDMRSWYFMCGVVVTMTGMVVLVRTNSLLILILGALLFYAYYLETKRLKGKQ